MTHLHAKLKEVRYVATITPLLQEYLLSRLETGVLSSKANAIIKANGNTFSFSQWVSPKRTRSYPYARVYNTLSHKNRITLIPFCKDEGADGDRDFIQWDTISMMSLLNVHVIIGYYANAEKSIKQKQKNKHKITKQEYDFKYVVEKIKELTTYQSSALHWNLQQIEELPKIAILTMDKYKEISEKTKVNMHGEQGIEKRIKKINQGIKEFKEMSRKLSQQAQHRESLATQPKERIFGKKVSISMKNLLGGYYHMTADEGLRIGNNFYLIEKKHSEREKMPSFDDIKDGFLKMTLFTNIEKLKLGKECLFPVPVIGLSSTRVKGYAHSKMPNNKIQEFIHNNEFNESQKERLKQTLNEAKYNNFSVFIVNSNHMKEQEKILPLFRK